MVASNIDFGVWTQAASHRTGPILPLRSRSLSGDVSQKRLREAIVTVRNWLNSNREFLEQAAQLDSKIGDDHTIEGLARLNDETLLNLVDQFAYVADLHGKWAEELSVACELLRSGRTNSAHWSPDGNELILELEAHLNCLRRVEATMFEWSHTVGIEFDRRHPDLLGLPFEPLDMGPTNSARLPPVL